MRVRVMDLRASLCYISGMRTNPSINMIMELPLGEAMAVLAQGDRVALSYKVRKLVRKSLEQLDDQGLETTGGGRAKAGRKQKSTTTVRRRLRCRRPS